MSFIVLPYEYLRYLNCGKGFYVSINKNKCLFILYAIRNVDLHIV